MAVPWGVTSVSLTGFRGLAGFVGLMLRSAGRNDSGPRIGAGQGDGLVSLVEESSGFCAVGRGEGRRRWVMLKLHNSAVWLGIIADESPALWESLWSIWVKRC